MKDKSLHYTNEQMAKDLIEFLPFAPKDKVLDAGSGLNKVWFKNLPNWKVRRFQCELDNGQDFYKYNRKMDWVIGNPPYHESWKFTEQAISIAQKGFAWLLNNQALNSHFTPARLAMLAEKGFYCRMIHVVSDRRWFGRYYFIVFTKDPNNFISWNKKTY